ncbi:MAG: carbohydrate ABC transporter permease [Deltaproteobacteria bacterium]|nr:MAG: carbohydrate ABC transporter permease [Deltaproteobacteria bacterium]
MSVVREKSGISRLRRFILYFVLSLIAATTIFPFFLMVMTSLKSGGALITQLSQLIPHEITPQNYIDVWKDDEFGLYFLNTLLITVATVLGNIVLDSMVAYALSRKNFIGRHLILGIIVSSMMIPVQVLLIPIFVLMHRLHLYDTLWALILPGIVQGFGIFLMKQYFDGLPHALDEAALIDGASDWQIFWRVLMPLAKPALAVLVINTSLTSWNAFLLPLILTASKHTRTLALGLALYQSQYGIDYVHSMAAASISSLPILAIFLIFQRNIIAGLTRGAVK